MVALGTISILACLRARRPGAAFTRANSKLREMLHLVPGRGRHIKKGRRKLAFNLRTITHRRKI